MDFSLPMTMVVVGLWLGLTHGGARRGGHVRRRQNRHIVVKVAGRDCLLSPILARRSGGINRLRAGQFEQHRYHMFEMAAD